jgi:cardiolipin synthase
MWFWALLIVWIAGWACVPHLLLLNKRPTSTLAWLWALFLFPFFGPLLYLMIGSEQVKRRRINRQAAFRDKTHWSSARAHADKAWKALAKEKPLDPAAHTFLESLSRITELPGATISDLEVLRKAPAYYASLEEAIKNATFAIEVQSYIWRDDEVGRQFLDLLIAAVGRGVAVRVLIDELGSFWLKESYFQPLVEAGGHFSWCHTLSPLRNRYSFNLRNHRKLQIIDGRIAFIGGMNFGREYLGRDPVDGDWADIQIRMEGSVVEIFRQIFAEDWFFATGRENIEPPPKPAKTPEATHFVQIPRGVDVRLLVSLKSEHPLLVKAGRSYYDSLLRRGIRIFEYAKGIEHSKYLIIDDDWVSLGSSNFDERSMRLNFELSLLALSPETNRQLARIFEKTIAESHEINRKAFSRRPYREKLIESALRPFSPVL